MPPRIKVADFGLAKVIDSQTRLRVSNVVNKPFIPISLRICLDRLCVARLFILRRKFCYSRITRDTARSWIAGVLVSLFSQCELSIVKRAKFAPSLIVSLDAGLQAPARSSRIQRRICKPGLSIARSIGIVSEAMAELFLALVRPRPPLQRS